MCFAWGAGQLHPPTLGQGTLWLAAACPPALLFHPLFPAPAADMARLSEEVFPCRAELLSGGLEGQNRERILQHLLASLPLLIPYPAW